MRVLHISALPVWPIKGKGGMPSLHETLRGHIRAGHQITLILPQYDLFSDETDALSVPSEADYDVVIAPCPWLPALKWIRRTLKRVLKSNELPFPARWVLNMTSCLLLTAGFLSAAARARQGLRGRFALIYAHTSYGALAGFLLRLAFRAPNVTRLYGTFLADLMAKPLVWLRYPVAAAGYLLPHSLLICTNDGTRGDEVARRLHINLDRFRFWQNGVDRPARLALETRAAFLRRAPSNLRGETTWICSCSRLSYWKRIDRIIRAFGVCRNAGQDCQLLLAGDGPEADALRRLARELGVDDQIAWFGALAHDEIWRIMDLSDIYIITNDVTNRCNPLYEAMCSALPVVSVTDQSTADLLEDGDNALLAAHDEPEQLGQCLLRLCESTELRERLGRAQKRRAEGFWTWRERMAEEVRELDRLVGTRRGSAGRARPA